MIYSYHNPKVHGPQYQMENAIQTPKRARNVLDQL